MPHALALIADMFLSRTTFVSHCVITLLENACLGHALHFHFFNRDFPSPFDGHLRSAQQIHELLLTTSSCIKLN